MPIVWQRAIQEQGLAAWPDYNTMSDPAAALTVARCGTPITWVTLDVTMRAPLRAAARRRLPAHPPLGTALGRMIDAWHASWFPTVLPPPDDPSPVPADAVAILHDPLALASLFADEWLRVRSALLASGIEDGVFRLYEHPGGAPATLATGDAGAAFEALHMARILRHVSELGPSAGP
jgi:hypothetical protein